LENHFSESPAKLVLHLPWFMNATSIIADGKPVRSTGDQVEFPVTTQDVEITWSRKPNVPLLSFDHSVATYKAEYRRRYDAFLRDGNDVLH
jgi:hypothetical protein